MACKRYSGQIRNRRPTNFTSSQISRHLFGARSIRPDDPVDAGNGLEARLAFERQVALVRPRRDRKTSFARF